MQPRTLPLPDGGSLAYAVTGSGPPLLLVAGLSGAAAFWDPLVPALAERFRVVLHDHRGTGRSSRCRIDYGVGQMAADLLALMDHLDIGRADLVGHSTGGAIGQTLAIDHPDRIGRLVLSATWPRACAYFRRMFEARKELLQLGGMASYRRHGTLFLYPPDWIAANDHALAEADRAAPIHPLDAEITARRIDAILRFDRFDDLGRIAAPTLVAVARDDAVTPPHHSYALAERIPGATLKVEPHGGHFAPRVHPRAFLGTALPFLEASR
ncbi:alpha/beta fold hydrolase [Arenibaculum sp.]|uniref:alpha/beta fold hydrolase n=1 Tax=Arenibaculum sp. TaxID=2865862 RepID=UPI002E166A6E|nr:alpha/beta fold hydrolase [Arenibaculum sp.]